MKKKLFAMLFGMTLVAGSASAAVRFGVGVNIGVHAPVATPRAVVVRPPMPGPGYIWIDGFYGPSGWVDGYWALPPFDGAFWVAPRFDGGRFVAGYWGGTRVVGHDDRFRGDAFRARDDHFSGLDRDDHFRGGNHDGRSNDRNGRDFRR